MIEQWSNMVATFQAQSRRFGLLRMPERLQESQSFHFLTGRQCPESSNGEQHQPEGVMDLKAAGSNIDEGVAQECL